MGKLEQLLFNCVSWKLRRRGVAQLVARLVWDQEVEGSSPFTPTSSFYVPAYMI
jgi:hypothetical protein